MADTKLRAPKATDLLKDDHELVAELFDRYEELEQDAVGDKRRIFERIRKILTVHAQIEEEIFYPAIAEVQEDETDDLVGEARTEHGAVKAILDELSSMEAEDDGFDGKMKALRENVEHHVEEEEKDLFALFKKLDRGDRDDISARLRTRQRELLEEEGPDF